MLRCFVLVELGLLVLQVGGIAKLVGDVAPREGVLVREIAQHGDLVLLLAGANRAVRAGGLAILVRLTVVIGDLVLVVAAS